jgi:hypothetical protein
MTREKEETMKYALLIYAETPRESYESMPQDARDAITNEYIGLTTEPGVLASEQLEPDTATTVRVDDGEALITDGPFANTKEVLGGFYLLDVSNLDEALAFAARIPAARMGGAIEVHRIVERGPLPRHLPPSRNR